MYGLTTYTPDYKSGGTEIIGLQIWWNWIRWNWGWETISWNAMNHHLRRKSFKTCASSFETCESFKTCESFDDVMNHHLRRDESRLYVVYYVCLLYLFRHRSIYSFLIEVYLHPPLKYIFFRHRSISPIFVDKFPHKRVTSLHRLATGSASPGSAIRGHWEWSSGGFGSR